MFKGGTRQWCRGKYFTWRQTAHLVSTKTHIAWVNCTEHDIAFSTGTIDVIKISGRSDNAKGKGKNAMINATLRKI